jgi:hypothetical protein
VSKAGFTYRGTDPGDSAKGNVFLRDKKLALVPEQRRRMVVAGARPGTWDFGSELDERQIELDLISGDNTDVAGTDNAMRALADLFDPTDEITVGDKGFGQLIFDSQSDRYWLAKLVNGPFPEYLPSAGKVRLTMRCSDPFAYSTAQYVIDGGSATITGFAAYRQAPEKIGWNLVINGGYMAGSQGWTLVAGSTVVADATSPTGYALRIVSSGVYPQNNQVFPVEGGKAYSFAFQHRADGTAIAEVDAQWIDAGGAIISTVVPYGGTSPNVWTEATLNNQVAPGNARSVRLTPTTSSASGIVFITAIRIMQQAGAPAAWLAAHQQTLTQKGLEVYEASTNLAADGDMEAVGTASYAAVGSTLTKDTVTFFAGAKSLKVASTGVDGRAVASGALAAGQAVTASVRAKSGDANCRLKLISTPSNVTIGVEAYNPNTTDWNVLRASGVIAAGDTGWQVFLVAGANTVVAYFDNFAVENKAYDTMNADPSGQAHAVAGRTVSDVRFPLPAGFDPNAFACVTTIRFDHAWNGLPSHARGILNFFSASNDCICVYLETTGFIYLIKYRGGVQPAIGDGGATVPVAGDTVSVGIRYSTSTGLTLFVSKNGGAVTSYTTATPEALIGIPIADLRLGSIFGDVVTYKPDGTYGCVRILKGGLSDATISALMSNPYQAQDETYELAVWRFEGATVLEDFASNTLSLEVGGTYWVDPTVELTAGGAYTGNIVFTDSLGNVLTWNGTVALNDVIKLESDTLRVRKNGALSMSGVLAGSKWPRFRGGGLRDSIVVTGIGAANIKALKATYRHRWI